MLYRTRISFILLFLISIRYFLNYLCIILIFIHLNVPIFSLVVSISLSFSELQIVFLFFEAGAKYGKYAALP